MGSRPSVIGSFKISVRAKAGEGRARGMPGAASGMIRFTQGVVATSAPSPNSENPLNCR
jgi:hypothetical protein